MIRDVPFGITTSQLIDSIIKANDQGKIRIRKVTDNTAAEVEIQVDLAQGISPDITIDALYAFTDCEISISPSACVINKQKPEFPSMPELLKTFGRPDQRIVEKRTGNKIVRAAGKMAFHFPGKNILRRKDL